jgi:hypothetical protein
VNGFPVLRLLCPLRLPVEALEFRWALAYLLPTFLIILHGVSRVRRVGLKPNDVGGVLPEMPQPLFAAPSCWYWVSQVYQYDLLLLTRP